MIDTPRGVSYNTNKPPIEELSQDEIQFWLAQRQALLMQIDAIERRLEIQPRTAELRKMKLQPA